jgi:hypothetical protein
VESVLEGGQDLEMEPIGDAAGTDGGSLAQPEDQSPDLNGHDPTVFLDRRVQIGGRIEKVSKARPDSPVFAGADIQKTGNGSNVVARVATAAARATGVGPQAKFEGKNLEQFHKTLSEVLSSLPQNSLDIPIKSEPNAPGGDFDVQDFSSLPLPTASLSYPSTSPLPSSSSYQASLPAPHFSPLLREPTSFQLFHPISAPFALPSTTMSLTTSEGPVSLPPPSSPAQRSVPNSQLTLHPESSDPAGDLATSKSPRLRLRDDPLNVPSLSLPPPVLVNTTSSPGAKRASKTRKMTKTTKLATLSTPDPCPPNSSPLQPLFFLPSSLQSPLTSLSDSPLFPMSSFSDSSLDDFTTAPKISSYPLLCSTISNTLFRDQDVGSLLPISNEARAFASMQSPMTFGVSRSSEF